MTAGPQPQWGGGPPHAAVPPRAAGPSGPRAGFGQRLAAYTLDLIVVAIALVIFGAALSSLLEPEAAFGVATLVAVFIFMPVYWTLLEGGRRGQTLGKRMVGIRVIDEQTWGPIGPGRAVARIFIRVFLSATAYLGYLWMLWDPERQTWHDKLTRSLEVPVAAYPVGVSAMSPASPTAATAPAYPPAQTGPERYDGPAREEP